MLRDRECRCLVASAHADCFNSLASTSCARVRAQGRSARAHVRDLSIKELWAQDALRKNEFSLRVVDTLLSWADVGTKSLEQVLTACAVRGDCGTLFLVCCIFLDVNAEMC